MHGILFIDYLEKERALNSEYYMVLLVRLEKEIPKKRPQMKKKKVLFHQDNAPFYKSIATMALHELHFELLPHPPYSPHGENFGGSARPIRRTDALNTRRAARSLFSRTTLPIWGNHYPKLGEPLRDILGPAVLSQALSSGSGNQYSNFRVDVTLNQRGVVSHR